MVDFHAQLYSFSIGWNRTGSRSDKVCVLFSLQSFYLLSTLIYYLLVVVWSCELMCFWLCLHSRVILHFQWLMFSLTMIWKNWYKLFCEHTKQSNAYFFAIIVGFFFFVTFWLNVYSITKRMSIRIFLIMQP